MNWDFSGLGALLTGTFLIIVIVVVVVGILLELVFLRIGVKAVKGSNTSMGDILVTWLLGILCSIIPCIGCILYWVVINKRHNTGFGNAILAWLIAGLLPVLIMGAIMALLILFVPGMPSWADIMNSLPY